MRPENSLCGQGFASQNTKQPPEKQGPEEQTLCVGNQRGALEEGTEEARDRVAFLKSKCLPICLNCVLLGESSLALEFHE